MYIFQKNKVVKDWLKLIYTSISKNQNVEFDVSVTFESGEEIQKLNKEYRDKDSSTDVLSFNVEDPTNPKYIGDLVLSIDDIAQNATRFKQDFHTELLRCIVHGTFHLLGYDHVGHLDLNSKPEELEEMFVIQEKLLSEILNGSTLQKIQKSDI